MRDRADGFAGCARPDLFAWIVEGFARDGLDFAQAQLSATIVRSPALATLKASGPPAEIGSETIRADAELGGGPPARGHSRRLGARIAEPETPWDADSQKRSCPVVANIGDETSDKIVHLPLVSPHSRSLTI